MLLLKLLSTGCVLGSLFLLVVWTVRASTAIYFRGQAVAREPNFSPPREMPELQIVSTAAKYGVSFLPLVRRWEAKKRLGVIDTLDGFEKDLIRAGVRHLITPEQFYAATIVSALFVALMMGILSLALFGVVGALLFGVPVG